MLTVEPTAERRRLTDSHVHHVPWWRWGPYLSERQWGTVREDYSSDGDAWDYFPHEEARSRAYRWGEDGLLGISDNRGRLCFAVALWSSPGARSWLGRRPGYWRVAINEYRGHPVLGDGAGAFGRYWLQHPSADPSVCRRFGRLTRAPAPLSRNDRRAAPGTLRSTTQPPRIPRSHPQTTRSPAKPGQNPVDVGCFGPVRTLPTYRGARI